MITTSRCNEVKMKEWRLTQAEIMESTLLGDIRKEFIIIIIIILIFNNILLILAWKKIYDLNNLVGFVYIFS